ncbi:hypothetical protein JCM5350_000958 [Sporobolomyces pararoseus]
MASTAESTIEQIFFPTLASMDHYAPALGSQKDASRADYEANLSAFFAQPTPVGVQPVDWNEFYYEHLTDRMRNDQFRRVLYHFYNWHVKRLARPNDFTVVMLGAGRASDSPSDAAHLWSEGQAMVEQHMYNLFNTANAEAARRQTHKTNPELFDALGFPMIFDFPTPPGDPVLGRHEQAGFSEITVYAPVTLSQLNFSSFIAKLKSTNPSPLIDFMPAFLRSRFGPKPRDGEEGGETSTEISSPFIADLEEGEVEIPDTVLEGLGNDAVEYIAHHGNITWHYLRSFLVHRSIAPSANNYIYNPSDSSYHLDESSTFKLFSMVLEIRKKRASSEEARSEEEMEVETGNNSNLYEDWRDCGGGTADEFRLTERGQQILTDYRAAAKSPPSSLNYSGPPIDTAIDRYPATIALEELWRGGLETMHLDQTRREEPEKYVDLNVEKAQVIVKKNRSMAGSCVITNCKMNANTLDEEGEVLREGLHSEKIPSPFNRTEAVCPMHFSMLYLCKAMGQTESESKQIIAWGVGHSALFSLARKFGVLMRCPYGCKQLLGQAKCLIGIGEAVVYSSIGACQDCGERNTTEYKRQKQIMENEILKFERKNEPWSREQLTRYVSPATMLARKTRCSVPQCQRMVLLAKEGGTCKTQTLSIDGNPICAPHFIGTNESVSEVARKYRYVVLEPKDATSIIDSLHADPTEQTLSNLARNLKILPGGLWYSLCRIVKTTPLLDNETWRSLQESFADASESMEEYAEGGGEE